MVITIHFYAQETATFRTLIRYAFADAAVPQLCEEQQPAEGAQFAASLCAVRALADYPMYSRHGSFKEPGCHEAAELGAEPAV